MKGDTEFGGVIFLNQNGEKILEAGHTSTIFSREFALRDNERILGVKSKCIGQVGGNLSPR
jgi:hypothetical protein